ncbi:hypothetical protein Nmel_000153, partial [Mimus melanotis]
RRFPPFLLLLLLRACRTGTERRSRGPSATAGARGSSRAASGHGGPLVAGGAGAGAAAAAAAIACGGRGTMKDGSGRGDDPGAELPQPSAGVHGRCRRAPRALPDLSLLSTPALSPGTGGLSRSLPLSLPAPRPSVRRDSGPVSIGREVSAPSLRCPES